MPVLIEGVSVLLRKGSIHERYAGGYPQFLFDLSEYVSLTTSNQLVCVQYKNHAEARALLHMLASKGMRIALINEDDARKTDAVLVDQVFGTSVPVYWIDLIPLARPRAVEGKKDNPEENILIAATYDEIDEREELRIKNWDKNEITYPQDWVYERSKSLDLEFLRMAENRSYRDH